VVVVLQLSRVGVGGDRNFRLAVLVDVSVPIGSKILSARLQIQAP
jgi:hypothetical protein